MWMKNVRNYCTKLYEDLGSPQWFQSPDHPILFQVKVPFDDDISATFIHRMIFSDVNIYRYTWRGQPDVKSVDIYVGSRHEYEDARLVWDVGRADPRGSERLGEREGGVKVELKPRAGRGFLAFPGRIRTRGGPFRVLSGTRRPSKIHPLPRV